MSSRWGWCWPVYQNLVNCPGRSLPSTNASRRHTLGSCLYCSGVRSRGTLLPAAVDCSREPVMVRAMSVLVGRRSMMRDMQKDPDTLSQAQVLVRLKDHPTRSF